MVMVAVIGADVAFVAVKDGTSPDPLAARPIEILLFVQLYVVPGTEPDIVVAAAVALLQYV